MLNSAAEPIVTGLAEVNISRSEHGAGRVLISVPVIQSASNKIKRALAGPLSARATDHVILILFAKLVVEHYECFSPAGILT